MNQFLGVNWDHPSGAALLIEDEIVAGVSEERFVRKKNTQTFPLKSLDYCLGMTRPLKLLDGVGIASLNVSYSGMLYHYGTLSIDDMIREQHEIWYPSLYEGKIVDDAMIFKDRWVHNQFPSAYWAEYEPAKKVSYSDDSARIVAEHLNIDRSRVVRIEHHWCHAYYGYYCSPFRNEKAVVLTIDGKGDGLNATVSIAEEGKLRRIYQTDKCILGRVYSHVTLLLGMKRLEHEYKVMGLAPYVNSNYAKRAFDVFKEILSLDGIDFVWCNQPKDSYFYFRERLEGIRFDHIAAGLQMWVEDMLCQWVTNIIKETNIDTLVISGGVSMNVRAMGKISSLPLVKRMFVPGSGSDDSNCIGAAIGAKKYFTGDEFMTPIIVRSLYIGPSVESDNDVHIFERAERDPLLIVDRHPTNKKIAEMLSDGAVIGRCIGKMEFGQRALGNRSLLADPIQPDILTKINAMIKQRDFWMPFAPVVMDTYVDRYLINPKKIYSPHMTIAYDTTPDGWKNMKAACHQADHTARAQILQKDDNPGLYAILESFEQLTGRGALLNTSFNLHGYPIVCSAQEAFDIFLETELDALLLPSGLITKNNLQSISIMDK